MERRSQEEEEAELLRQVLSKDAWATQHEEKVSPPMQEEAQSAQESVQYESMSEISVRHKSVPEEIMSWRNHYYLCAYLLAK